jgi:type I restriction enzyme S subunit
MERYPKYKDSGIDWLGNIPEHWDIIKIKRLSIVKRGASPRPIDQPKYFDDNGEFAWVRIADVTASNKYLLKTTQILSILGNSLSVKQYPGDFFVSIAGSVGKPIITKIKCCIHDGFVYFPKLKINKEFIYYLFEAGQLFQGLGKFSTQLNLNTDTIGNIQIPLPPLEEQKTIARFLDRKLEQIGHFISNKQRLIELLKEQKTAIVNRAVTKGLNPDAPMKPSGIEWLGDIPANWEVETIGKLSESLQTGPFGSQLHSYEYVTGGIPVINPSNMKDSTIFADVNCAVDQPTWERLKRHALKTGDIIFARRGEMGRCALVTEQENGWICGTGSLRMQPKRQKNNSEFLIMVLSAKGVAEYLSLMSVGSTMENLNTGILQRLPLSIPPVDEQQQIVEYIHKVNLQTNQAIAKTEKEIELIQEYRTTLISDAVTGKIDVRELTHSS